MVQGVLVGMYLSNGSGCPCGDEVEDNFHYFYVCPLFICQRLLLFTQLRDLAYFLNIDILLKGSPDLSFDDNVLIELCPHLYLWNQKTTININIYQFDFVLFTLNLLKDFFNLLLKMFKQINIYIYVYMCIMYAYV